MLKLISFGFSALILVFILESRLASPNPITNTPRFSRPLLVPYPPSEVLSSYSLASNKTYIPIVNMAWAYLSGILVPPYSMSKYVTDFGNNNVNLYAIGCDLGDKAEAVPGTQELFVFLDFGQAYQFDDMSFGADLINTRQKKRLSEIMDAVKEYARGFYTCSGSDITSNVIIGIGINNDSQLYSQFPLFVIGDAAGCRTIKNNTDCGSEDFPNWTTFDVWYANFGSGISYPIPEIYSHDWTQPEQWLMLSIYSAENTSDGPMLISGSFTQYSACQQVSSDPDCPQLDNPPDDSYKKLYTVLYSDLVTRDVIDALVYSSDISYAPSPTPIP